MELDVLVVGAGPVGLASALFLARHGLSVRIIDQSQGPAEESRAIGIQSRTLEILEMAGAVDEFVARGHRLRGVTLHGERGGEIGHVAFDALPTRYPYLMTLPQSDTERILAGCIEGLGVRIERRTTLRGFTDDGAHVTATVDFPDGSQAPIPAGWLIGADGAHSTVRQTLGMGFAGKTYDLKFLLADLRVDSSLPEQDAQVFAKTEGLFAMFPLGGGRYRLVADNPPGEFSEDQKPSLAQWQLVVDRRASVPMRLSDPNWTAYFRVHSRMVEHLRRGRVFLMGDAAHVHSPALAQGMNTGIHDAWNLAWKLALVRRSLAAPDLLESYEAERLPVERRVLAMTDFTQNVVGTPSRARQVLRDLLLPVAMHIPFVRERASETVSELAVGYLDSPIVEDHPTGGGPHAGDRAPDALLADADGADVRLMSLFGQRHVLLATDGGHDRAGIDEAARGVLGRFGDVVSAYTVTASAGGQQEPGAPTPLRPQGDEFAHRYGRAGAYFLVRPDGYVAFRSGTENAQRLFNYLARTFNRPGHG